MLQKYNAEPANKMGVTNVQENNSNSLIRYRTKAVIMWRGNRYDEPETAKWMKKPVSRGTGSMSDWYMRTTSGNYLLACYRKCGFGIMLRIYMTLIRLGIHACSKTDFIARSHLYLVMTWSVPPVRFQHMFHSVRDNTIFLSMSLTHYFPCHI